MRILMLIIWSFIMSGMFFQGVSEAGVLSCMIYDGVEYFECLSK